MKAEAQAMMKKDVHCAGESDREELAAVLARAFADDPAVGWTFSDESRYAEHFRRFANAFAGPAFELGTAHWTGCQEGASLWLPPGAGCDEEALSRLFEEAIPAERRESVHSVFEQMGHFHPAEPHWHLALIGVVPAMRGRGIGSRLLEAALAVCDERRELAYLEATSPRNVSLYRRHGFEPMGEIQAGTSPVITPMLRTPR